MTQGSLRCRDDKVGMQVYFLGEGLPKLFVAVVGASFRQGVLFLGVKSGVLGKLASSVIMEGAMSWFNLLNSSSVKLR